MAWNLVERLISEPAMTDWLSTKAKESAKSASSAYQLTVLHQPLDATFGLGKQFAELNVTSELLTGDVFISTFNTASIAPDPQSQNDLKGILEDDQNEFLNNTFLELLPERPINVVVPQGAAATLASPAKVVTVVVDSGIAFAQERFRLDAGGTPSTRIVSFIDMNRRSSLTGVPYHTLEKPLIDALLHKHLHNEQVDEHALYVEAGLIDYVNRDQNPVARASSHGTQVMDAACGYDATDPDERAFAEQHAIIAVELPQSVVADSHGHRHETVLTQALHLAQKKVFELFPDTSIPVILNYSFGNYAGRHDGQSPIEVLLDDKIYSRTPNQTERERGEISMAFIAAGNGLQQRTRARYALGELTMRQQENLDLGLDLVVQPDSKEHVFLQIWTEAPKEGAHIDLQVGLRSPNGTRNPIGAVNAPNGLTTSVQEWTPDGTTNLAAIYYQVDPISNDRQLVERKLVITICIRPTASDDIDAILAPAGVWELDLAWHDASRESPAVDIWIERGDTPSGFTPRGRQAYFDHPDYPLFREDGRLPENDARNPSPIKREGTISAIATGKRTTVVSANRVSDGGVALYSSIGPMGDRVGPHLSAPGDFDWVNTGMLFAGNYSGSVVPIRGTSISAPQVARRAAWMCINTDTKPEDIVSELETEAAIDEAKRKDKVSPRFAAFGRLKPKNQSETERKRRKLMADR